MKKVKGTWPARAKIKDLPEPYRSQAIENSQFGREKTLETDLMAGFSWWTSPEKFDYWNDINDGFHPENIQPETTEPNVMKGTLTLEDGRTFSVDVDPNELQRPEPNEPDYFDFAAKCPVDEDRPYSSWPQSNPFSIGRFCAPKHLREKCLVVELDYKAEIHNYGSYQLITFEKL